jgi:uncharacterized membrane protein (DUF2068 family)
VAAGIVLVTHQHADYGRVARRWAEHFGLNPGGHFVSRLIQRAHALTAHQVLVFGVIALAYGVLECVEGVGLWRRRRWAEYLTVVATSVLVPVEVWELSRHPSALKAGGLVVNLVIVAYLVYALRRHQT